VTDAVTQRDRGGGGEGLELVKDTGALRDGGTPGDQQRADGGENPAAPGGGDVVVGEDAFGGGDRVDAV
jgi:hypothetical protein